MEHNPNAAEAITGAGRAQNAVPMEEVLPEAARETERLGEIGNSLNVALGQAVSLPGQAAQPTTELGLMTDKMGGDVGRIRDEMTSEVERTGVAKEDPAEMDHSSEVTDRFRALYMEMTNWQVAWSIAQRSQQDTNHLLRGN